MTNPVDDYLETPGAWRDEMRVLRSVLLDCGLVEALKWAKPCYARDGENIAIMQPMKDFLALMFFKGALVDDPDGLLREQGPNSRSAKRLEFTGADAIRSAEPQLRALVASAINVEASGAKLPPRTDLELPEELTEALAGDAELSAAFDALTPGRQRGYVLHIAGAKQAQTRRNRIAKHRPRILAGKGLHD
ncbi:YdeI/OmpD-associated family protein [Maricaulis sp.]|uniref:YdeI/OmpD-associated family protein n=1 Tax=Maricaulis sp. TaxID=1486257 RepID=UPI003296A086